jgi:hypothetical protein
MSLRARGASAEVPVCEELTHPIGRWRAIWILDDIGTARVIPHLMSYAERAPPVPQSSTAWESLSADDHFYILVKKTIVHIVDPQSRGWPGSSFPVLADADEFDQFIKYYLRIQDRFALYVRENPARRLSP